jgi:uncharacterized phage-associated protein
MKFEFDNVKNGAEFIRQLDTNLENMDEQTRDRFLSSIKRHYFKKTPSPLRKKQMLESPWLAHLNKISAKYKDKGLTRAALSKIASKTYKK